MKKRVAWGLAAILAVVVLVGVVVLVANYQSRLPKRQRTVILLPMGEWAFSHQRAYWVGPTIKPRTDMYRCGFFEVWLTHRLPAKPLGSTRHGTGQ